MSEYTQGGARFGAAPMPFAVGSFRPMFDIAARTGNAYSRAYLKWQDEVLRFTSTRLQRDAEFGTNLLKCDKWADAARLQQSWVTSAVEDYVSEASKLMELATDLTNDMARSSSEQVRATADEARRAASAAGEQMREQGGAVAEGMSRFARAAGEQTGAAFDRGADEARKAAETASSTASAMADEGRKFAEEVSGAAKERGGSKRR